MELTREEIDAIFDEHTERVNVFVNPSFTGTREEILAEVIKAEKAIREGKAKPMKLGDSVRKRTIKEFLND